MNTEGPKVTIEVDCRCDGCKHETSEKYYCQSDWGYDHYCNHPDVGVKKFIGETGTRTPDFCPFKKASIEKAISEFNQHKP